MAQDPKQCLAEREQVAVAREFFASGRLPQAVAAFETYLACYPQSPEAAEVQLLLGIIYARNLKRYEAADRHLTNALGRLREQRRRSPVPEVARGCPRCTGQAQARRECVERRLTHFIASLCQRRVWSHRAGHGFDRGSGVPIRRRRVRGHRRVRRPAVPARTAPPAAANQRAGRRPGRYDFESQPITPLIEEGLRRSGLRDAVVYIQLTRGVAPRSHVYADGAVPTVVMTFKPFTWLPGSLYEEGVAVMTVPEMRWNRCYIKAITLLPNVLAKNEAVRRGFFDAIFITHEDEVRESSAANVFLVRDGAVRIPPRNELILHGITQSVVMECAQALGVPLTEGRVNLKDLIEGDEVFLSSTTIEVLPVVRVDDHSIGTGRPGPRLPPHAGGLSDSHRARRPSAPTADAEAGRAPVETRCLG